MTALVRSFDVFDTVLTRRVGEPEAVHELVASRLTRTGLPVACAAFVDARRRCELNFAVAIGRHPTLREIYDEVARVLNLDPQLATEWARVEEDLELELCVAVPGAREMVDAARRDGATIVFISDTPHTETLLRQLLEREGLAVTGDLIFGSAQRRASKAQGSLFRLAADALPAGAELHHTGDNLRSDVAAARLEGWYAHMRPQAQISRYEELLERKSSVTGGATSWLAGSSRLARLSAATESELASPVATVACGVLAPLLIGYALWTAHQARRAGVKRLYYVARDGQVMLDVAKIVLADAAPELELRYLYGSRQAWTLPAASDPDVLARWLDVKIDFTPASLAARVGLSVAEARQLTRLECFDVGRRNEPLSQQDRRRAADKLQAEPARSRISHEADRLREAAIAYFRQEGLFDGTPSALVDAGWTGETARSFDKLLASAGGAPVEHYFIGYQRSREDLRASSGLRITPWLFDGWKRESTARQLLSPHVVLEMLCAGTEGRTTDYAHGPDGTVVPVLTQPRNEPVLRWGLTTMQDAAKRCAVLARAGGHLASEPHVDWAHIAWELLLEFWMRPTHEEALAWGDFPWEDEIWPPFNPIAQRITLGDVLGRLGRGDKRLRRENSWRAGSAAVSKPPWRTALNARDWQERNRDRVARVPRRLRLELAARRNSKESEV